MKGEMISFVDLKQISAFEWMCTVGQVIPLAWILPFWARGRLHTWCFILMLVRRYWEILGKLFSTGKRILVADRCTEARRHQLGDCWLILTLSDIIWINDLSISKTRSMNLLQLYIGCRRGEVKDLGMWRLVQTVSLIWFNQIHPLMSSSFLGYNERDIYKEQARIRAMFHFSSCFQNWKGDRNP